MLTVLRLVNLDGRAPWMADHFAIPVRPSRTPWRFRQRGAGSRDAASTERPGGAARKAGDSMAGDRRRVTKRSAVTNRWVEIRGTTCLCQRAHGLQLSGHMGDTLGRVHEVGLYRLDSLLASIQLAYRDGSGDHQPCAVIDFA